MSKTVFKAHDWLSTNVCWSRNLRVFEVETIRNLASRIGPAVNLFSREHEKLPETSPGG